MRKRGVARSAMKVVKRQLCAFLLLSYVLFHVKQSYESSEEEREDGEALLVTWCPRVDALSRKQWRRKRRKNCLMAASRTRDTIATAKCGLRCVVSLIFVRLVKAGDVELNPGPKDKRSASDPLSEEDHRWLFQKIKKISAKWRDVGEALDFSYDQLEAIADKRSLKTDDHFLQELLRRWLKWAPPNHPLPCVEDLATALRSVEEERTAYDLMQMMGPPQPRNEQAATTQEASPLQPPSPSPQPLSPLVQFTSYLKAVYGSQKFPNYEKWPPCSSKKYINLACIEKDKISKKMYDKFTEASIHGNIDDIVSEKHPMEFHQIAKKLGDGSWPKLILVEGAPGVGKSTFAWKLCRKWTKGKFLSQYKLVVLLRLRDKRVREAKTLYDLIYYDIPKKRCLIVEELILSNGKETLLLFEGYDELPTKLQKDKHSILVQIISGNSLPEATVLVTSRHSASGFIIKYNAKRISQHIEILGFTKGNIQTYINENVKDCEERQGLERYLSFYPHIRTMMYIPLNSVIVVEVYHQCHDKNEPVPKTMTELYTSLVRTLLIRYLKYEEVMLETFEALRTYDKYEQFCQVCMIAYDGIANNQQIIFYKSDIPDGFEALDLMQEVHELYVDKGDCVSYNFLHLTIQEYLAAVHLSLQPVDVQIQHFKEKEAESSFEMVLRFLSGLTKFHNYPQQDLNLILEAQGNTHEQSSLNFHWLFEAQNVEYISGVLKKDVFSVDDLSTPFEAYALGYCVAHSNFKWKSCADLTSMSDMLIRGLQAEETQCKGTLYEVIIDVNKSTQEFINPTILIKFFRSVTCGITSFSFFSGLSTELVKDMTSCFGTLTVTVKVDELEMEHCKTLGELIRSSTYLRHIILRILPPDEPQSAQLAVVMLEPIVTALGQNTTLWSVSFSNDVLIRLLTLTALIRTGRAELYPRVLQLLDIRFDGKDEALYLGKCHTHRPNTTANCLSPSKIRSLYINDLSFGYVGDTSFLSDLCTLSSLVIENCELSGNSIKLITEGFLVHCKGKASDEKARSLVDVEGGSGTEQSNKTCTLEHIELRNCAIDASEVQHLAQALRVNTSVKTLDLSQNHVSDKGAKELAEMLGGNGAESSGTVNTTLQHVDLSRCNIGPVGAQHLAQALCVNTSVKTLKFFQQKNYQLHWTLTEQQKKIIAHRCK